MLIALNHARTITCVETENQLFYIVRQTALSLHRNVNLVKWVDILIITTILLTYTGMHHSTAS